MLTKVGFIAPARIDLQRAKRVQPALGKIEGAAWPVHECLAGDEGFEVEAGLLDQRPILRFVIKRESLLLRWFLLGAVLGMPSAAINLHPTGNPGDNLAALV